MTERVHAYGSKIFLMMSGGFGRVTIPTNLGEFPPVAPSAIPHRWLDKTCRPLTKEDLETIMRLADGTALLISTRGAVSGSRYLLDEDEITVGRDPRADILLDDSTVSRAHAVFRRSDGRYSVIDAGSLNGTYVNRQRVDQQELKNGDEIILGKFRLVYFDNKAVIAG